MRKITIKKVKLKECEILQKELNTFIVNKSSGLLAVRHTNQWYTDLLLMDIAQKIYYSFRSRIENATQFSTLSFAANEAITLIQVILSANHHRESEESFVLDKFKNILHESLINL
ncbi:MAG TPA: hypothetical protein VK528_11240 [Flavobacterium sp.]|nr:hypothetical protein [Flavobacterium sp.]